MIKVQQIIEKYCDYFIYIWVQKNCIMKKIFTSLFVAASFATVSAQWTPAVMKGESSKPAVQAKSYYSLDIDLLRSQLKNAPETGNSKAGVVVSIPTMSGKIEKFVVYSRPVVVKSLEEKYQLGSYVGKSTEDPTKLIRFSVSPTTFASMIIKDGTYEFIDAVNKEKTVYAVHPKTVKTTSANGLPFECTTSEHDLLSKKQIDQLATSGRTFTNDPTDFSKASDKKYRTMRLAMSVNGEYTIYHGGTVAGALEAINATLTRCNGVFENDFALHLNLQDFPQLIFTNPSTDPYGTSLGGWNQQLQTTLTNTIGNDAYDIGHMFGASGGGGNAGCIGCVCVNPTTSTPLGKGSGITSPADGIPEGDNFDIDYVAHEMGHQLGANHTFSHGLEGTGQNVEPGSGSTIMGYAGITGATDVQPHSDAYFHINSIIQVQNNLTSKTCDVETAINNNPPVITAMADQYVPKSTAFYLTAQATDPENDPITFDWEQVDNATTTTNKQNLGTLTSGPNFRSWNPTTSPVRYFPKFTTVLAGDIKNLNDWEAASTVARNMNFRVTVRDNNADKAQQQTQHALQKVVVGATGPFAITSTKVYNNGDAPLTWDVAGTAAAPYNVANVKIDYTADNGATWITLAASTPNDGTEALSFAGIATGTVIKARVSAIGGIFYTIKPVTVSQLVACDGTAPVGITVSNLTPTSATVSWDAIQNATYILRYRAAGTTTWTEIATPNISVTLNNLEEAGTYEYQVAAVCSGTTGNYSAVEQFTTQVLQYCTLTATNSSGEYISKVAVTSEGGTTMTSDSGATNYTDYSSDASRTITLYKGSTNNTISVTKAWQSTSWNEAITAWIDFDRNGTFDADEVVMQTPADKTTPVTATFQVPNTADTYVGTKPLRMRVALKFNSAQTNPCGSYTYGEVEDYAVMIPSALGVSENGVNSQIQVYPNPATDVLNISKISGNAEYAIYSVSGQLVSKGKVSDNKVNVSKLPKGVYIISVDNNGTVYKTKFIKN